ncbi:MAG TPA: hypothetical protein VHF22_02445 [Planctomycetota bacterium]|nr:hypothetical protein [Planctomycetota bacterium]
MRARAAARGVSLLEVSAATALMAVVVVSFLGLLVYGVDAYRQSVAEERALRTAGDLVDAIARELKDAPASTLVFSAAAPTEITFRRMTGYDPTGATDDARRVLTPPITIRRVPMAVPGASGLYAVERVEAGERAASLGGFVAESDAAEPALPGLRFDVASTLSATFVTVTVTVAVPAARSSSAVARLATTLSLEVN